MADDKKKAKQSNPEADAKNWEQRLRTEQDGIHKWNEAWGGLFNTGLPHEYEERERYLASQLKQLPAVSSLPKYGGGEPFKEVRLRDFRRKKMFEDPDPLAEN